MPATLAFWRVTASSAPHLAPQTDSDFAGTQILGGARIESGERIPEWNDEATRAARFTLFLR